MPLVMQGLPGSVEGSLGRYTHLLHVNLLDVGQRQETSREDHAKLLLTRFPARGVTGVDTRRVDYRVPACVSRRARHTLLSSYQHGPLDQVSA